VSEAQKRSAVSVNRESQLESLKAKRKLFQKNQLNSGYKAKLQYGQREVNIFQTTEQYGNDS